MIIFYFQTNIFLLRAVEGRRVYHLVLKMIKFVGVLVIDQVNNA